MNITAEARFKIEFSAYGYDANGARRVWATGTSKEDATARAKIGAAEYVASRPDTGPVADWTFNAHYYPVEA